MKVSIVALALLVPAAAAAQGRAAAGSGGALPDISAIEREIDRVVEGPPGRVVKGALGAAGLAASLRYGAYAAFSGVSGDGDAILQVGVRGDGSTTDEPATDTTTATSTGPSATSTATSTQ